MIAMLAGPLAPFPRPTTAPTTMLSRMSVPMPSAAATISRAISSAPATRSLLPNPQGVNPQTLQPESGLTYTSRAFSPSRVADAVNPARASIFGRTGVDGGAAPSSPTPAASVGVWSGGSPPSRSTSPAANAMIPDAPAGQMPGPGAAAMLQTPSGGGGLPSMPSGDRADGPAAPQPGDLRHTRIPTIAIVGGVAAILAIGAFVVMRR